jgi:hypothetical protein
MRLIEMAFESTSQKENLCALYYPETICLNDLELKYYLLLYDKIFFLPIDVSLNPGHTLLSKRFSMNDSILTGAFRPQRDAHYSIMYASEPKDWDDYMKQLMELYDELEEKEILIGLRDERFENPSSWHPLKPAVEVDMKDKNFVSLCSQYRNEKIFVPKTEGTVIKGGGLATRPPYFKGENSIFSICSERLNSALLLFAEKKGLYPVSPYRMYVDLLSTKLKRISLNQEFQTQHGDTFSAKRHKISILSWELTTEVVPQNKILKQSAKDILRYRSACKEQKDRFNTYLFGLESSISSEPWNSNFRKELDKIIHKELLPEIQKVKDNKLIIWEKLFGDTLKSLSSMKVLPPLIGLHLVPGLSFHEILTLSTLLVGSATLPEFVNAWKDERQQHPPSSRHSKTVNRQD